MGQSYEHHQADEKNNPEAQREPPHKGDQEWTKVQNWVFDAVMPNLSGNAFKVFCVVLRQTWGWKMPGAIDNRTRKQWDIISWSQFQGKTGIAGKDTLKRALDECLSGGFIHRLAAGQSYAYTIPTGLETMPVPRSDSRSHGWTLWHTGMSLCHSMETIPVPKQDQHRYGNGTATGMETIHTKAKESKGKQSGAGETVGVKSPTGDAGASPPPPVIPPDYDAVYEYLIQWGVRTKTARKLALECAYEYVNGWGDETKRLVEQGLVTKNPTGFLIKMLSDGEPLPARCITCGGDPEPDRVCLGCGKPLCHRCSWIFTSEQGQDRFWCKPCLDVEDKRRKAPRPVDVEWPEWIECSCGRMVNLGPDRNQRDPAMCSECEQPLCSVCKRTKRVGETSILVCATCAGDSTAF